MPLVYLTIAQAIEIHQKTVEVSGGGTLEQIEVGKLESVLEHIQNDDYYPTIEDKLTSLSEANHNNWPSLRELLYSQAMPQHEGAVNS